MRSGVVLGGALRVLLVGAGVAALLTCETLPASAEPPVPVQNASFVVPGALPVETEVAATPEPDEPKVPAVIARIDLSDQTMTVYVDERLAYVFKVSTARKGYITPVGQYQAQWLSPRHRSRKYDNAPMPWSVFFHDGWAVHGTTDIRHLGKPASHGCVRLHPDNAKVFFGLVKEAGLENTLIAVVR
jgi:lipoprotein-anchoring transpeptidase ErfK/SrfK